MHRAVRVLLAALVAALLTLVLALAALRTSLPRTSGTVSVHGLSGPVEIDRDLHGVPTISAGSREDAYFALGYAHAQDRLWQMELSRREASGRLAELLGPRALPSDRLMRTLGLHLAAERDLEALSPRARGAVGAYVAGVNAYLGGRRGLLPVEFLLLRHRPEPWREVDVLAVGKLQAWRSSDEWRWELLRARAARDLSPQLLGELLAPGSGAGPPGRREWRSLYDRLPLDELAGLFPPGAPGAGGSNAWAVAGEHALSGMPLLASDANAELEVPAKWYLARLSAPGLQVAGATVPGLPAVLLGRNERIAWGLGDLGADVQDLFVERLSAHHAGLYRVPGGLEPLETRRELIGVRDQGVVELRVRASRHGPLLSDLVGSTPAPGEAGESLALALQWTALTEPDRTLQAALELAHAADWREALAALQAFHAPPQGLVYADVEGNIGLAVAGRAPLRSGADGVLPAPGWSGRFDWEGSVPFDELPRLLNPPSGRVIAAGGWTGAGTAPLTGGAPPSYQAERVAQLLDALQRHTAESFALMQSDQLSLLALDLLPLLRSAEPHSQTGRLVQALLLGWDGTMAAGEAAPLAFWSWYLALAGWLLADELGAAPDDLLGLQPLLERGTLGEVEPWCDDVATAPVEECGEMATRALRDAAEWLELNFGADPAGWRWGEAHPARFLAEAWHFSRLAPLFELAAPQGGGPFTLDAAPFLPVPLGAAGPQAFTQVAGPLYRAVYDLSGASGGFVLATGQSGNPLSTLYRSLLGSWLDGALLPIEGRDGVTLLLVPRP